MGLDTFAAYSTEGYPAMPNELFLDNDYLCGGIFSGGGASFRGKIYADFIHAISGISLYQEVMQEPDIRNILLALHNAIFVHDEGYDGEYRKISNEEIYALYRWFNTVLRNKGVVLGWW